METGSLILSGLEPENRLRCTLRELPLEPASSARGGYESPEFFYEGFRIPIFDLQSSETIEGEIRACCLSSSRPTAGQAPAV